MVSSRNRVGVPVRYEHRFLGLTDAKCDSLAKASPATRTEAAGAVDDESPLPRRRQACSAFSALGPIQSSECVAAGDEHTVPALRLFDGFERSA